MIYLFLAAFFVGVLLTGIAVYCAPQLLGLVETKLPRWRREEARRVHKAHIAELEAEVLSPLDRGVLPFWPTESDGKPEIPQVYAAPVGRPVNLGLISVSRAKQRALGEKVKQALQQTPFADALHASNMVTRNLWTVDEANAWINERRSSPRGRGGTPPGGPA